MLWPGFGSGWHGFRVEEPERCPSEDRMLPCLTGGRAGLLCRIGSIWPGKKCLLAETPSLGLGFCSLFVAGGLVQAAGDLVQAPYIFRISLLGIRNHLSQHKRGRYCRVNCLRSSWRTASCAPASAPVNGPSRFGCCRRPQQNSFLAVRHTPIL